MFYKVEYQKRAHQEVEKIFRVLFPEHFVCDNRLEQRIEAIRHKQKNAAQKEALLSLRKHYDMDTVKDLSGFDRRLVCVPKFCPRECPGRQMCRYQRYLEESRKQDVFIQICNHNYLLADTFHRAEGYKPLLSDYRILVIDEAHGVQRKELLQRLVYDPQILSKPHGLSGVSSSNSLL